MQGVGPLSVLRMPCKSNRLEGHDRLDPPPETRIQMEVRKVEIRVTEDVVIQPGHEMIVPASPDVPCYEDLLVEPTEQFVQEKSLMVCKIVIDGSTECSPLRIMNLGTESKLIRRGTIAAHAEPFLEIRNANGLDYRSVQSCNQDRYKPDQSSPGNNQLQEHLSPMLKHCESRVSQEQFALVRSLLDENADVFSKSSNDIGKTGITKHKIDTGNTRPIKQPVRRVPLHLESEAGKQVEAMLKNKIIEPSDSPWASPIVLVKKKDGGIRFCVDYRKLNAGTIKDAYPLPRIDQTLDSLSGSKWFSTFDLSSGYWQVEMEEADKNKTAFVTKQGLFHFNVMPFGLCNAPSTFERLMEKVLAGLQWEICLVYLDDIIIFGKTFRDHIDRLRQVFNRIRSANLKLKPKKCELFCKSVKFLGHVVSEEGISTDPDKTKAVMEWPVPRNVKELRSFLGLCSYYRRFIKGFSTLARSLFELTEKNRPFVWSEERDTAFLTLKQKMVNSEVLGYPDPSVTFIIDTDASNYGIGAVLSQIQPCGDKLVERPLAYASRALTKTERAYCVTRRELLAVVYFVKYFRHFLFGKRFQLRVDHPALRWLLSTKNPEGQIARWIEILDTYQFDVEHRPGKRHSNADALSRRPCRQCGIEEKDYDAADSTSTGTGVKSATIHDLISTYDLKEAQDRDSDLMFLKTRVMEGNQPSPGEVSHRSPELKSYIAQWEQLTVQDGILYRRWDNEDGSDHHNLYIVPVPLWKKILEELHDTKTAGHLGYKKTVRKVRQRFFWKGLASALRNGLLPVQFVPQRRIQFQSGRLRCKLISVEAQWNE